MHWSLLVAALLVPAPVPGGDVTFTLAGRSDAAWTMHAIGGNLTLSVELQGPYEVQDLVLRGPGTCKIGTGWASAGGLAWQANVLYMNCQGVPAGLQPVRLSLGWGFAHGTVHMQGGNWV